MVATKKATASIIRAPATSQDRRPTAKLESRVAVDVKLYSEVADGRWPGSHPRDWAKKQSRTLHTVSTTTKRVRLYQRRSAIGSVAVIYRYERMVVWLTLKVSCKAFS